MVYFEVEAGLCNRLRGMASAYFFAKDNGQPLTVIWKSDVNCNLRFDSFFTLDTDIPIKVIHFDCMGTNPVRKAEHLLNRCREAVMKARCAEVLWGRPDVDVDKMLHTIKAGKNVYLTTCHYWYEGEKPFSIFKLKPGIADKVEQINKECGNNCVGVHIRRTDHQDCIRNSPTEAFIREMQKEPEDTVFFVASDDASERENLVRVFGKNRIKYNAGAELSRGTVQGMEDAVIDLYMLSKTRKILGSDGSSFSDTAGLIGEIPVIMCDISHE